jgi:hypothetical protein
MCTRRLKSPATFSRQERLRRQWRPDERPLGTAQDEAKLLQVVNSWPKPVSRAVVAQLVLPRGKKSTAPVALIQFADSQKGLLAARTIDQVHACPTHHLPPHPTPHTTPSLNAASTEYDATRA